MLLWLVLAVGVTSCLTFEESYVFKRNGSGSMRYLIDMSEMKPMLDMREGGLSDEQMEDLSYADAAAQLANLEGISGVEVLDDPENFHFGVAYDFENIEALNAALNLLLNSDEEEGVKEPHTFFTMEGKTITRTHLPGESPTSGLFEDEDEETAAQATAFLESMTYRINFEFAKPVKVAYAQTEAKIGGRKNKALQLESNFMEIAEDAAVLNATVVLK
ncbi:MAG: hypothetical protein D6722_23515 [Bacteroidetes bacterium]|nr:MAG: hypothetical protein D6722_23515 [Bacteroidota bacterium]